MKINMPITTHEILMQHRKPIVSKTDLKGIITYVNQTFVDISGYSREELIGKNHNIIRHPHMPVEAFAWLWDTIQQDQPWRGVVKNRCKNGDFYWVEAYVTPIRENGRTVGYMSVRNIPDRKEVEACEALYRDIREKRATLPKRGFRIGDISFILRLNIVFGLISLLLIAASVYDFVVADSAREYVVASCLAVGSVFVTAGCVWVILAIRRFLENVRHALAQLAEGNFAFTSRSDTRDEFGHILNDLESMRLNLRAIIADVVLAAKEVDSSSQRVEVEMRALLDRSNAQSEHVTDAGASVEQMHRSIISASEHTRMSAEMAQKTMSIVQDGNSKMKNSIASVQQIVTAMDESRTTIGKLHDSIKLIEQLTQTIKDVADQTNLLALNAAIEAARAGEQGRGFAVVADEVRKLAERSSDSTVDISNTVDAIQQASEAAIASITKAASEVTRSTGLINQSSASLNDISSASGKTLEMADEVSVMLQQQATATEDVATNMAEIQELASGSTESIRSTKTITDHLTHISAELTLLVKHFEKSL